jgi:hypothetical protein
VQTIRFLLPVAGELLAGVDSIQAGQVLEVDDAVAAAWADGERAVLVDADDVPADAAAAVAQVHAAAAEYHQAVVDQLHRDARAYHDAVVDQLQAQIDELQAAAAVASDAKPAKPARKAVT